MTYQKQTQTHDDDNADEASSLLAIVTASPTPSFSLGQEGMPATKKNGVPMRGDDRDVFPSRHHRGHLWWKRQQQQ